MIRTLDRPKSQGERFMESFSQSAPKFGEAFENLTKYIKENKENKRLKELTGEDYSGLSQDLKSKIAMEKIKQKTFYDLFSGKGVHDGEQGEHTGMPAWEDMSDMQKAQISFQFPNVAKTMQQESLSKAPQKKLTERAENLIETGKDLKNLLPYVGSAWLPGKSFAGTSFNRESVQKRAEFDTLVADWAGFFRDLDTRGQLPLGMYEKVIEPRLPNSQFSERINLGRIEAMEKLAKRYGGLEKSEKQKKSNKKAKPSLDDLANEYLH